MTVNETKNTPMDPLDRIVHREAPAATGYGTYLGASFGHALVLILRRQRLILAAVIAFLPATLPLATAFLSVSSSADDGAVVFVSLVENLHIAIITPLLALFFATMLVAEDVEAQTIPYVLTRPIPRSAWVLGRFAAYLLVTSTIVFLAICLTFAGCTVLARIDFSAPQLMLVGRYGFVAAMALLGYGSFTIFLGVLTKRPIVIGVLVLYGWQHVAMLVPGVVDFLTLQKYVESLLPKMASQRGNEAVQTVLATFEKEQFLVGPFKAGLTLLVISGIFLALTALTVRTREYASARAAGS